jgi:hypothetical protein
VRYDAKDFREIADQAYRAGHQQLALTIFSAVDEVERVSKHFGNGFSWYPCGCTVSVCREHQGPGPYPFSEGPLGSPRSAPTSDP